MVPFYWTKGLSELQMINNFKRHLLNHWSKFKIISQNCSSWWKLHKIAQIICSTKQRGCQSSRSEMSFNDIFSWTMVQIQNNFTELFLIIPFTKIAQMVLLHWTKGPQELQIRNIFKHLLNHWSKFEIISQNCSSWCLLPKLHKKFWGLVFWAEPLLANLHWSR